MRGGEGQMNPCGALLPFSRVSKTCVALQKGPAMQQRRANMWHCPSQQAVH